MGVRPLQRCVWEALDGHTEGRHSLRGHPLPLLSLLLNPSCTEAKWQLGHCADHEARARKIAPPHVPGLCKTQTRPTWCKTLGLPLGPRKQT